MTTSHDHGLYTESLTHDTIRLLQLFPGRPGDEIRVELQTVSLSAAEDTYEAISYVWGEAKHTVEITCNGRKMAITITLAQALSSCRHATETRLLWADAICINQNNYEEKSHQVKRMAGIYMNAKRVLVHLGLDPKGIADDCFQLIKSSNRYLGGELPKYSSPGIMPLLSEVRNHSVNTDQSRWRKLQGFAFLPWFRRLWVIQEAGIAKDCIMIWGDEKLDIAEYMEFILWINYRPDFSALVGDIGGGIISDVFQEVQCRYENTKTWRRRLPLSAWIHNRVDRRNTTFLSVLAAGREMEASNKLDYVYAFLGLPMARRLDGRPIVEPDYSKEAHEVFIETSKTIVEDTPYAASLLGYVDHKLDEDILLNTAWPSWVPHWDRRSYCAALAHAGVWYYAGGLDRSFKATVMTGRRLVVSGAIFDSLSWVSELIERQNLGLEPRKWDRKYRTGAKSFMEDLWETVSSLYAKSANKTETQENFQGIFGLTMCQGLPGKSRDHTVDLEKERAAFGAYLWKLRQEAGSVSRGAKSSEGAGEMSLSFLHNVLYCHNRRIALTRSGRLVLTPPLAKVDDLCCVLPGAPAPFLLRKAQTDRYRLVGACYVDGVMRGEIMGKVKEGKLKEDVIIIE